MIATNPSPSSPHRGLLFAGLLALLGLGSLYGLLRIDLAAIPWPLLLSAVLLRTLLHTGLFIVGHDAMHGVLVPGNRRWNDRLGALALHLYAALPYRLCRHQHRRHHAATACSGDPDVHPDPGAGFLHWYCRFMAAYLSAPQMGRLLGGWALLSLLACRFSATGLLNVLLFVTLPLLLSSLQLFGFGTYLPHRGQRPARRGAMPVSLNLPVWLSLLACFHFGYHLEHHQNPQLAWYELPGLRRRRHPLAPAGGRA